MALRWSAVHIGEHGYKHRAPPEQNPLTLMKRRNFMIGATGAVALLPRTVSPFSLQKRAVGRSKPQLPLKQLRDQYRRDLFTDFLPFMEKYVIDPEFGGFR